MHTERENLVSDSWVDHLRIRVRDPAASKRFYTTIAPHAGLRIGVDEPEGVTTQKPNGPATNWGGKRDGNGGYYG